MDVRIKPCPFCGSHEITICRTNDQACWIRCEECGADAESSPAREEAIEIWNCRVEDDGEETVVTFDQDARFQEWTRRHKEATDE